jgi:hypothetical protein
MGRTSLASKEAQRSVLNASEVKQTRGNAMDQMNRATKRKLTMIERSINDLQTENLRYYHRIGKICEEIRSNPNDYVGNDGTPGMRLIEQALSAQARTLRKAALFAREYDDTELAELTGHYHAETNFRLHWGHVSFLLTVPKADRQEMQHFAVQKMLDPAALHEVIKKKYNRKAGHGRKHTIPENLDAQVRQIRTICRQWVGKRETAWQGEEQSIYRNLMESPSSAATPELVEHLQEIEELMEKIAEYAATDAATVARVVERLQTFLQGQEETTRQTVNA